MPDISTLIEDIYDVFGKEGTISDKDRDAFAKEVSRIISERVQESKHTTILRVSNLGTDCDRQLYYLVNHPELSEPLEGHTKLKFLIGDLWEAVLIFLAKAAGHTVEGQQDEVDIHGVKGHWDGVIDGVIVDVKSASPYSFSKFEKGLTEEGDAFGYLEQINSYQKAGQDLDIVKDKKRGAFLVGNKVLGKLTLDFHDYVEKDYEKLVSDKQAMLSSDMIPPRGFSDEEDGKSGNRKLGTVCSYCSFKEACWPNLQTIPYAGGPRFLTVVKKKPKLKKHPF